MNTNPNKWAQKEKEEKEKTKGERQKENKPGLTAWEHFGTMTVNKPKNAVLINEIKICC